MAEVVKDGRASSESDDDSDRSSTLLPPATAAFSGYRPFPPVMNLYSNFTGVVSALKTQRLCGATPDDFLYLVELHFGYTPRGPLNFGQGFYLRNGTTIKDPILAAAGNEFPIPLLIMLFDPETAIKLPPADLEKNPRDMVTETLHASASKDRGVAFRFGIEVGVKRRQREEFEWRKIEDGGKGKGKGEQDPDGGQGHEGLGHTWYKLHRLASNYLQHPGPSAPSSSSSPPPSPYEDDSVVAELSFRNVMNLKHIFKLELKGAGLTGELGDRWRLMVVMTALALHWLRQNGKTKKVTVGAAQKIHSK